MKQAILGIFILLFAVAAPAATVIHMDQGTTFNTDTATAGVDPQNASLVTGHWQNAHNEFEANSTAYVNNDTQVQLTWAPTDNTSKTNLGEALLFFSKDSDPLPVGVDMVPDITSSGNYTALFDLLAGAIYHFKVLGSTENLSKMADFKLTLQAVPLQAVPIPTALWLFAPALMGLLGLRRKSKGLVVA